MPRWAEEEALVDAYPGPRPLAGSITIEQEGLDRRVLCLRGDVDTAVATHFTSAHGRGRVAVDAIDAGTVTFICSSGLALLLTCAEASFAAGRHPMLRTASRQVDRALRMAGIDSVFPRPEPPGPAPRADSADDHPGGRGAW
jgi:anti-anti-sigma regulatory factor